MKKKKAILWKSRQLERKKKRQSSGHPVKRTCSSWIFTRQTLDAIKRKTPLPKSSSFLPGSVLWNFSRHKNPQKNCLLLFFASGGGHWLESISCPPCPGSPLQRQPERERLPSSHKTKVLSHGYPIHSLSKPQFTLIVHFLLFLFVRLSRSHVHPFLHFCFKGSFAVNQTFEMNTEAEMIHQNNNYLYPLFKYLLSTALTGCYLFEVTFVVLI